MKRFYKVLLAVFVLISFNAVAQQDIHPRHKGSIAEINVYDAPLKADVLHKAMQSQSLVQIMDSIYQWRWDTLLDGWALSPYGKFINYVYDGSNNQISYELQSWDGSVWVNNFRNTFSYDNNNNLTSWLSQNWDGSIWVNSFLQTRTYDLNNNETSNLLQIWNGSMWENIDYNINTYIGNNLMNELSQSWNGIFWEDNSQYTYTYDVNNNQTSLINQNWNGSAWNNNFKRIYTYNANNIMTSELYQTWFMGSWYNFGQFTFTYDANNNRLSYLEENFNGSIWINNRLVDYSYDANNNMIGMVSQDWIGNTWVNRFISTSTYDINNFQQTYSGKGLNFAGTSITGGDSAYIYFNTVNSINSLTTNNSSISIHPNPTTTSSTITAPNFANSTLFIYDITGRALSQQPFNGTATINISHLTSGIYIAAIKDKEGNSVVAKVVRE